MFDKREKVPIKINECEVISKDIAYLYTDNQTKKKFVIKIIGNSDDYTEDLLLLEFKKMINLSGEPEIASAYFLHLCEIDNKQKVCYSVEYIEGDTLSTFLSREEAISIKTAINILETIIKGVTKAHSYNIAHFDLHNENILITKHGFTKIIDFHWYSNSLDKGIEKDINDIKERGREILEKVDAKDKNTFKFILDHIEESAESNSFLSDLEELKEIAFEVQFLNQDEINVLYYLLNLMLDYNDSIRDIYTIVQEYKIPENLLKENNIKKLLEIRKKNKLYIDINENIMMKNRIDYISPIFTELGLIEIFSTNVKLKGKTIEDAGYFCTIGFKTKIKFLRWSRFKTFVNFLREYHNITSSYTFEDQLNKWFSS
tara:strand:- start:196186 stop:197304 length:1119 start_codon:yes stop_codon:yes gene_type:complete